eukprot:4009186-Prymnesium_polylepis.1
MGSVPVREALRTVSRIAFARRVWPPPPGEARARAWRRALLTHMLTPVDRSLCARARVCAG